MLLLLLSSLIDGVKDAREKKHRGHFYAASEAATTMLPTMLPTTSCAPRQRRGGCCSAKRQRKQQRKLNRRCQKWGLVPAPGVVGVVTAPVMGYTDRERERVSFAGRPGYGVGVGGAVGSGPVEMGAPPPYEVVQGRRMGPRADGYGDGGAMMKQG